MRPADHSSRGVLPTLMSFCVWSRNIKNEVMARVGPQRHRGNYIYIYIYVTRFTEPLVNGPQECGMYMLFYRLGHCKKNCLAFPWLLFSMQSSNSVFGLAPLIWIKFLRLETFYKQFLGFKSILVNHEISVEKEHIYNYVKKKCIRVNTRHLCY